jgi:hypothetical protein
LKSSTFTLIRSVREGTVTPDHGLSVIASLLRLIELSIVVPFLNGSCNCIFGSAPEAMLPGAEVAIVFPVVAMKLSKSSLFRRHTAHRYLLAAVVF